MATDPSTTRNLEKEVKRRRTFAIISHPDAGKTTFTEKLLLYGGAIHLAGAVKAKKNQKHTTSDWMDIEKQRGISISTTVLQFEYDGYQVNLLDTPGHKDFSEDTYRTLMAVDAAVMLVDAAKGVEAQTRKLFEVCRMSGIPIFTFVNKMDRPSREPLDLMDEIEKILGIRSCPMTWPIGQGDRFRGIYDRENQEILFYQTEGEANVKGRLEPKKVDSIDDPLFTDLMSGPRKDLEEGKELHENLKAELELVELAGDAFDAERVLSGNLTPVYFGSALNNFGVERFFQSFLKISPEPVGRTSKETSVEPQHPAFSAFIFKILANMDPKHRDRVAFMRICSGKMERNLQAHHIRLKKPFKLAMPLHFFGQDRVIVDEAWPGDIVGILDTNGSLRIGDTLTEDKKIEYTGMPTFSPEHFSELQILDPMKRKQMKKGVDQLSEEGVIQVLFQRDLGDKDPILGAVGVLQFEVFKHRLQMEYGVDVKMLPLAFKLARWVKGEKDKLEEFLAEFARRQDSRCLVDRDGFPVVLFQSEWGMNWAKDNYKEIEFMVTAPPKTFS